MTRSYEWPAARKTRGMRSRQTGMTLLEIMIVLAILALVMGLVIGPRLYERYAESQRRVAKLAVNKLADQDYPAWALVHPSDACPAGVVDLTGSREATTDPWDTPYQLHCGSNAPPVPGVAFGASSDGQDHRAATPDDIQSWRNLQ